jgi:hypothetical protein
MLTHFKRSISIALSIGMLLFNSCTKTNEVTPEDNEKKTEEVIPPGKKEKTNEEIAFEKSMLGIWTFTDIGFQKKSTVNLHSSKTMNSPTTDRSIKLIPGKQALIVFPIDAKFCLMEFLEDGSYIILDAYKNVFTGKFSAIDDSTLELTDFGTVTKAKPFGGFHDIKVKQTPFAETIDLGPIGQSKSILESDKNAELFSNTWLLSNQEDGIALLNEGSADKIFINFSIYGSYREKRYKDSKLTDFLVKSWLFAYGVENKIQFRWTQDKNEITIIQLTKDILKIQESKFINGEVKVKNLVFTPQK